MKTCAAALCAYLTLLAPKVLYAQSRHWVPMVGESTQMGSIYTVIDNGPYLFAGCDSGLFRSSDEGYHWQSMNAGIQKGQIDTQDSGLKIQNIVLDRAGNMYVNPYTFLSGYYGVYKSSDFGIHWKKLSPTTLPDYIFLNADSAGGIYAYGESEIFRSTNQGNTWTKDGPVSAGELYSNMWTGPSGDVYLPSQRGFYKRSVSNNTWQFIGCFSQSYQITCCVVTEKGRFIIGADTVVAASSDGVHWDTLLRFRGGDNVARLWSNGSNIIAQDRYHLSRSTDSGRSWWQIDSVFPNHEPEMFYVGRSGTLFYGGKGAELFASTDTGRTWVDRHNSMASSSIQGLNFGKAGKLFAGGADIANYYEFYRSSNSGLTWTCLDYPGDIPFAPYTATNGLVFAAPYNGQSLSGSGYLRSSDAGDTWQHLQFADSGVAGYQFVSDGHEHVITSTSQDFRESTDGGLSWKIVLRLSPLPTGYFHTMAIAPDSSIWVCTWDSGLVHRDHSSGPWRRIVSAAGSIAIDSEGNVFTADWSSGVHKVDRSVNTLIPCLKGSLSSRPDIVAGRNAVYVTRDSAVFWSTNAGKTWSKFITLDTLGFEIYANSTIATLMLDSAGTLWGGGASGGVFHVVSGQSGIVSSGAQRKPLALYPNPASTRLLVAFFLDHSTQVRMEVLDVLGRIENTESQLTLESGTHEIPILLAGMHQGLHFLRMTLDGISETAEFIVTR